MNAKHQKYIEYIAKDIELPYLKSLEAYGLKQDEMNMVLGIVFNQPVFYIRPMNGVYNKNRCNIYREMSDGSWERRIYNKNNKHTYYEDSNGFWCKYEHDNNGYNIYYEDSYGVIEDNR